MPNIVFGEVAVFSVKSIYFHQSRNTHVDVSLLNGFSMTIDSSEYPWRKRGNDIVVEIKSNLANIYKAFLVYNNLIRGISFKIQLEEAWNDDQFIADGIESQLMHDWDLDEALEPNNQMNTDQWPQNQLGYNFDDSQTLEWLFSEGNCQSYIVLNHVE